MEVGALVKGENKRKDKGGKGEKTETLKTARARALARAEARTRKGNVRGLERQDHLRNGAWVLQQLLDVQSKVERLLASWKKGQPDNRVNTIDGKVSQSRSGHVNKRASSKGADNSSQCAETTTCSSPPTSWK